MHELMMRVTDQLNALEIMRKEKIKGETKDGHNTDERIDKLPSF